MAFDLIRKRQTLRDWSAGEVDESAVQRIGEKVAPFLTAGAIAGVFVLLFNQPSGEDLQRRHIAVWQRKR